MTVTPSPAPSRLAAAEAAIDRADAATAYRLLAEQLTAQPADAEALRLMSTLLGGTGRLQEAEGWLARALAADPSLEPARFNRALVLHRLDRSAEAHAEIVQLLARAPDNQGYRKLEAAILVRQGAYDAAIAAYQAMIAHEPRNADAAMSLGHVLKTVGRTAEAITAYRHAVTIAPAMGAAWWSLANLKTLRFDDADIAAMAAALADPQLPAAARLHIDFAMGKALEDRADYAASFRHYAAGNALRRAQVDWNAAAYHAHMRANEAMFTPDFFAARHGQGCLAPDPIFIVGLPRSGSTLIEQILGSHSRIEGTMELPYIGALARELAEQARGRTPNGYLGALMAAPAPVLTAMGERYLAQAAAHRSAGKPYFIDKLPNNFAYLGLIHLILPNAIIIDARRDAMATCFSAWKQHFANGQAYTYELGELGRFYREYERLMAHFDRVLPGRVLRVQHEELVADTEAQVRRMLAHIGVDFEPACLAFHENTRPVRTPSAEQVRQPITSAGLEQWKHFEPWLGDLKAALAENAAQQNPAGLQQI
jgi:tetratricopeptide (TPR) repeat protein